MKKLISILTLASFSLVPITSIISCQPSDEKEEIVGETIDQEILDAAIKEINLVFPIEERQNLGVLYDRLNKEEIVQELDRKPELLIMWYILYACRKNDNQIINKLDLKLKDEHHLSVDQLLHLNLNNFKVVPTINTWFEGIKSIFGEKNA